MRCGTPTPSEPGVPPHTEATGAVEVEKVRAALGDRYRVEGIIGEGGMATVYLAEDLKHRRKVAVKVMRPALAATLGTDRFLREVEIAAQLTHPHILPMHDSGESDGLLYYVMPYVEGESLQAKMRREGQMSAEEACRLAREVAGALAHAHERGIIHRDIKPANILLSAGHALVADFGIARAVGEGGQALTQTGLAVGTPQYMSPEQATGERDVDGRADVYALGSVLYEMLVGEPPFTGPTAQAVLARSLTEPLRPVTATRTGLPPQVSEIVTKALARSPADRYPTAGALAQALGSAFDMSTSGVRAPIAAEPPSPVLIWSRFAIGSLAGLSIVFILMRRWGLQAWALGLAAILIAIGAGVLVTTSWVEGRRSRGWEATGLWRLFTRTNAAIGGALALGLWAVAATMVVATAPTGDGGDEGIRLAVLPFELRGDAQDGYLADGIADEVRASWRSCRGSGSPRARARTSTVRRRSRSSRSVGSSAWITCSTRPSAPRRKRTETAGCRSCPSSFRRSPAT